MSNLLIYEYLLGFVALLPAVFHMLDKAGMFALKYTNSLVIFSPLPPVYSSTSLVVLKYIAF